ncbi:MULTISPECIES: class I SAM-dependent methyltransferase [Tenacibaculum]|uniref:class I SAM-dependent methyltransferase n=1 Tax=Tenacibaculum TaxID=104267 RepID=UPI001F0A1D53|nr:MULTISPECIES: class I SAM-dependent methyltransferase [Tenacibaculum]MCH3882342.1 class I SAM-dependent methyltransferase [Tenacibaculum aquimarinum]MDO6600991.1 class I SAM-dependent methyltransferase [Tenacibaculum sp. 1_MG-2023]
MIVDWFTSWFNTPYYHILYKHRNDNDAQLFMKNITQFLQLPTTAHIADLPCGKGRHAVFLNSLGYKVTGGDLSENSIKHAKQFENDNLKFEVWDMRNPLQNKYEAIFNLFTSFGYFEADSEDITVLKSMKNGLKEDGYLVLDFLNVAKLRESIVKKETKTIDNIEFHIQREIKNGFILKHISFFADGKQHNYTEQVKFLELEKFQQYFEEVGLEIQQIFGNYKLETFEAKTSDRLIFVLK